MFSPVRIVRFWLPALIFVVGLAMLIISPDIIGLEGAALMLGGGLGVVVSNRIHQMGLRGEKDRDEEMGARAFYGKYGVWPDEASEELLDRAEREGDIEPRSAPEPAEPAPALPPRVDPHGAAPSRTGASSGPSRPASAGHPHTGTRRAGGIAARRRPRR